MRNSAISIKSRPLNKSTLLPQDLSNTDSDDVNLSPNKSHVPHFGGQIDDNTDPENDDIENFVENSGSDIEEDETELLTELRQLSRNLTTTRSTNRKLMTNRQMNTLEDFSTTKTSVKEFSQYYQKSVNRFLQKKKDDLENKRKVKEQNEALEFTHKPNLIAKQQNRRHIPISERAELVKAKKESELLKMKKAQEERMEREFKQLTFAPKINRSSVSPGAINKKKMIQNGKMGDRDQSEPAEAKRAPLMSNSSPNNKSIAAPASRKVSKQLSGPVPAVEDKKKLGMSHNVSSFKAPINTSKSTLKIERVMTEPCDQTDAINEKINLLGLNKSNRRLSPERSRSPIGSKTNLKKSLTQDSRSSVKQGQKLNNKKTAEEELLAKRYQEALRGDLSQKMELRKQNTRRESSTPSHNTPFKVAERNNLKEMRDTSPVVTNHRNTTKDAKETTRDISRGASTFSQREMSPVSLSGTQFRQGPTTIEREKENIGNDEEIDIVSIKQNLLNIQDNLQTLKQSFKCFQNVQPIPKSYLSFVESPPKDSREPGRQSLDARPILGNNHLQIENKTKQTVTLNADPMTKKCQGYGTSDLNKEHIIDNDTESFGNGNMSFSAAYEHRPGEKNLPVFTNKSSISVDSRKEDSMFSWKFPTDMEGQSGCLEMSNLFSRPSSVVSMHGLLERKQESQPQSLKDLAENTLKKFKGFDR